MTESQFEAVIVNPEFESDGFVGVGVLELGKRLLVAATNGETENVRALMNSGAPFATDWLGTTSLHAAALGGHLETCELLLRSGILKDARTKVEKTPLHMACQEGHYKVAMLLIANGADVNACDMLFMTPLHWAVEKEKIDTIRVLVQNGAEPSLTNKFDKSCFDIAADADRKDIVEMLHSEPRQGEYTVRDLDARPTVVKREQLVTVPAPKAVEIRITSAAADRPRAGIVLPQLQNRKVVTSPAKKGPVKSDASKASEEHKNRLATLQLLEEHGIEMLEGEDINLVASAVGSGQTLVLTEAGKQALSLTGKPRLIKRSHQPQMKTISPKIIRVTAADTLLETLAGTNKIVAPEKKGLVGSKATVKIVKRNPVLEDIGKKLEEARREAEQYKEMYTKKQREAEEYRSKLQTTMSMLSKNITRGEDEEDELGEEEEEEEDDEEDLEEEELEDEEEETEAGDEDEQ